MSIISYDTCKAVMKYEIWFIKLKYKKLIMTVYLFSDPTAAELLNNKTINVVDRHNIIINNI